MQLRKAYYIILTLIIAIFFLLPAFGFAQQNMDKTKIQSSKILVLYKERDKDHAGVINYLGQFIDKAGFIFDKMDVEALLAKDLQPDFSRYKGIMTCYLSSQMVGGDVYPRFLLDQMEAGRKIIIVGSYGAYQGLIPKTDGSFIEWNESTQTINTFFWPFGLEFLFGWTSDPNNLKVIHKDKDMAEYQASLSPESLNYYQHYKSVNPANKIYLEIERTDMIDSKSAFVVHTPFGGMILESYGYFWDPRSGKMLQRVDLERFIREGFAGQAPEVPTYKIKSHRELLAENPLPEVPPEKKWVEIPGEIKRHVLALYKKSESPKLEDIPLYDRAELALNHLGVIVDYHAVEDGLPDDEKMRKYRGVVTWHATPFMLQAEGYGNWLIQQINNGLKVVIIQDYGAGVDKENQTDVDVTKKVFRALGIEYSNLNLARAEYFPEIIQQDAEMIGFEKQMDNEYIQYTHKYVSTNPENQVHFSVEDKYSSRVDLVVTGPSGGVALENSAFYFPPGDAERVALVRKALNKEVQPEIAEAPTLGAWIVDPYQFFSKALDLKDMPVPDYTTLNGSRIYYTHIDGDALRSISLIDKAHFAAKFVLEEHFKPYRDLPFSASVISIQMETAGNEYYSPLLELSREIFALPNVEIASHATTHPFNWVLGDPYIVNPKEYPWKIDYRPQDYVSEVWGTKLFINENLAPEGKACNVLFWSGECNPDERALKVIKASGLKNINGGDPIYDDEHPSIAGLCPLSTPYASFRQFHTSAQNDYLYSLFLTGDWGGQKKVINHFEKTETPRRILPMNLYYHFYAGIKHASLDGCKVALDYFRKGKFAGLYASEYVSIAEDYFETRLWREDEAVFIENGGQLKTIRFNKDIYPDVTRSKGVVGYFPYQGQTYVHLAGKQPWKIVFGDTPVTIPYLVQSTYKIDDYERNNDVFMLFVSGFGKGFFEFGGLIPGKRYTVILSDSQNTPVYGDDLIANGEGHFNFECNLEPPKSTYALTLQPKD